MVRGMWAACRAARDRLVVQWLSRQEKPGEALLHLLAVASTACENFSSDTEVSWWASCHRPFCLLPPISLQLEPAPDGPARNCNLVSLV